MQHFTGFATGKLRLRLEYFCVTHAVWLARSGWCLEVLYIILVTLDEREWLFRGLLLAFLYEPVLNSSILLITYAKSRHRLLVQQLRFRHKTGINGAWFGFNIGMFEMLFVCAS